MFKILQHLRKIEVKKETTSHYTCVCPVCGDDNFKIRRNGKYTGAYKCWSNNCSSADIKKALGIKPSMEPRKKKYTPIILAAEVPFTGNLIAECKEYNPLKVATKKFVGGLITTEVIYSYSKSQRVLRIDNLKTHSKYVYIQYRDDDFVWVSGAGNEDWPVYVEGLEDTFLNEDFDTILFVEGEKTAEYCKKNGIAAVTVMSGCYSENITKTLLFFKSTYPKVKNLIYVPDADVAGEIKAKKVQNGAWSVGLGCKIFRMSEIVESPSEGMDLADLTEEQFLNFKDAIRTDNAHLVGV